MDATYFQDDAVDKQLKIEYDGGMITNEELHSEEFELTERLCSESQLRFGSCEAATLKFKISNVVMPLKGKWITVTDTLEKDVSNILQFGKYKVDSDKPTADHKYRDIVAYDAMYDITSADVADWYNTILPTADSTVTLKQFRDSFLSHFGIEQEDVELINDSMVVAKTVEPTSLSGKTVITAICEINGCFGHIGRNGKFQYIFLKEMSEGLYPSNTLYPREDLYPVASVNAERISNSHYIRCEYEDFKTAKIDKLQIRQEENDIGCICGAGDNCYIIQDNFLLYGKTHEELQVVAANLYAVISKIWYCPAHIEAKGNPCLEVGTGLKLHTQYKIIYTYILQRVLKGIQALRDTYDAEGEQYQTEKVNSVQESIVQLKGKTNTLARTVEETRLEIKDIEQGLSSRITQTAKAIETEVIRATAAEGDLSSKISQTAEKITAEVTRAINAESTLSSRITQTAETISAEVERATAEEGKLSAALKLTAESISTEVTRAQNAENALSSRIMQTAEAIELKVSKGEVSSQLNLESGQVTLKSNRFVLEATNCSISKEGNIRAKNVDLTGKIKATSGEIGGFTIGENALYNAKSSIDLPVEGIYMGTDGISCGRYGVYTAFKVTSNGEIEIKGNGSIEFSYLSSGMKLDYSGISLGLNSWSTVITKDKIQIYSTYINKDTVHCAKYGSPFNYYTDINGDEIELHGSSGAGYLQIKSRETVWASSSGTYYVKDNSGDALILLSNGYVSIIPSNVKIGNSTSKIGFFGDNGSTKQAISTITATSPDNADLKSKINELITALKAYNLIG